MAATANMIAHRDVFDTAGLFREDMRSGGDAEWGHRASSLCFPIAYAANVTVYHPARNSMAELVQKARREAGGHYMIERSSIKRCMSILAGMMRPFRSWMRMIIIKDTSIKEKIIAGMIRYYLRLTGAKERLMLVFGIKKAERV